VEIEPLLVQIDMLAPGFGRVSGDLTAIVSRGRAKDFKGVMQNTRLVLEAILRDLVTRELKQTPGKAMLDELISKFRQQANAGLIPTNILAHMGTVQAWGNLSSHDHAGALSDDGVKVGEQEVAASLNSMVAILVWYAGRAGLEATFVRDKPKAGARRSLVPRVGGIAGAVLLMGGTAAYFATARHTADGADPLAGVDVLYRSRHEPLPPPSCRRIEDGKSLALAKDPVAFEHLEGPEADYLLARIKYDMGTAVGPELERAVACPGFSAALSLSGKVAVREAEAAAKQGESDRAADLLAKAAREFDAAIAAEPTFKNARFNRAVVLLKRSHVDEATKDLTELVAADPSDADSHFWLGVALEEGGEKDKAHEQYCAAAKQGYAMAKSRCDK
jgi:hypothetical protein